MSSADGPSRSGAARYSASSSTSEGRPARVRYLPASGVLGDGQQPGLRPLGLVPAPQRPEGVEERRLGDVLGLVRVPHVPQDEAVDVPLVAGVQPLEVAPSLHFRRNCPHCYPGHLPGTAANLHIGRKFRRSRGLFLVRGQTTPAGSAAPAGVPFSGTKLRPVFGRRSGRVERRHTLGTLRHPPVRSSPLASKAGGGPGWPRREPANSAGSSGRRGRRSAGRATRARACRAGRARRP